MGRPSLIALGLVVENRRGRLRDDRRLGRHRLQRLARPLSEPARLLEVGELDLAFEPSRWAFAERQAAAIAAHWARLTKAKPSLFNGRVLLLGRRCDRDWPDGTSKAPGRLFRDRLCRLPRLDANSAIRASLSTIASRWPRCAPTTARFCSARWRTTPTTPARSIFPPGRPIPDDVFDDKVDLEASARRELLEETGLLAAETNMAPGWTVVMTPQRIACMKLMTFPLPAAAAQGADRGLPGARSSGRVFAHAYRARPARHRRDAGADLCRRLPALRVRSKIGRITVTPL